MQHNSPCNHLYVPLHLNHQALYMKKIATLLLAIMPFLAGAQCTTGYGEIIIQIVTDSWPTETSWAITNPTNGAIYAQGTTVGDTVCVPENSCVLVEVFDTYGDGIYAPGGYWIYYNGAQVATGNSFGAYASHSVACAPGSSCNSPVALTTGEHTASFDNTWYTFTPTQTGMYVLSTCGLSTCDTRLYVYQTCPIGTNLTVGPEGTYAYNDNANCGLQSSLNAMMIAGTTYIVRVGDTDNACTGDITFSLTYNGPVTGCTDITACNYNPLAETDDGSCIYFPNPACAGPDLEFDSLAFINSLSLFNHTVQNCDVTEGCVTGYGTRNVIAFTSKVNNIGTMDYYLGTPSSHPEMFNTVNCHGHTHYEGYGDYRLYDLNGTLIPAGHKNGFCVMDLCGSGQYNCGNMGISAGCYDVYGMGTQCQWIDVTDVPDGTYRLAVIINPQHLPDALGRHEINYVNNALQVCINITRVNGVINYQLVESCAEPFTDCNGVVGGAAVLDCNGVCGGTALYGNTVSDENLNMADMIGYMETFEEDVVNYAPCYDLDGDGALSAYDMALLNWCFHNNSGNPIMSCHWPRNIVNPQDSTSLAISNVNFNGQYVDIELRTPRADISSYQFRMSGIHISDVVSLTEPLEQPKLLGFNALRNEVFAVYHGDSAIARLDGARALVRIYYDEITSNEICIDEILEISNTGGERTITAIAGNCVEVDQTGIGKGVERNHLTIMPNPASQAIYVQAPEGYGKQAVWEIMDASGRVSLRVQPSQGIAPGVLEFPIQNLAPGVYLLRATRTDGHVAIGRLVRM